MAQEGTTHMHTTREIIDNRDARWPGNHYERAHWRNGQHYRWICECDYMSAGWFTRISSAIADWQYHVDSETALDAETAPEGTVSTRG